MIKTIALELKKHAPFTLLGALSGIIIFILIQGIPSKISYTLFYVFHPLHVFFSAFVTVSLYKIYKKDDQNLFKIFLIGYLGSVGIATISDSVIPFLGESLLDLPNRGIHLGFIEKWYLVNPIAILGIAMAIFIPSTKFPHFGHVLLSTWASLFHITMAMGEGIGFTIYTAVLLLLFLAVWLPCCVSDIVFPLLFVNKKSQKDVCSAG